MARALTPGYSIEEALRRFADPQLVRRLDQLSPHSNSFTRGQTEHLHREYQQLRSRLGHELLERLRRGEIVASGVDVRGEMEEGAREIPAARWTVLEIDYDLNEVVGPGGLVITDVRIQEAGAALPPMASSPMSGSQVPASGFVHDPDYRRVWLDGEEFQISPKRALVIQRLHEASQARDPWVHYKRLRGPEIESKRIWDLFRPKHLWERLIESEGTGRYRLRRSLGSMPPESR